MAPPDRFAVQVPLPERGTYLLPPDEPTLVVVTMRWEDGSVTTGHTAWVRSWTDVAVECVVEAKGHQYQVWLPRADVEQSAAG